MRLRAQNPREREPGPHSPISRHVIKPIRLDSPGIHGQSPTATQPPRTAELLICNMCGKRSDWCPSRSQVWFHHGTWSCWSPPPRWHSTSPQAQADKIDKGSGLQWTAQVHLGLFHPDPATTSAARPTVTSASCEPVQLDCSFSWTISGILFWCLSKDTEMRVESALHLDSLSLEL